MMSMSKVPASSFHPTVFRKTVKILTARSASWLSAMLLSRTRAEASARADQGLDLTGRDADRSGRLVSQVW